MKSTQPLTVAEPVSKSRLRLWLRLLKASRHIEAELRERLRLEFATTLPRFDVMSALYRTRGGLKMSELSGVLKVSNGNVTGIVDRLVEDGFALREQVPADKRAFRAILTAKGRSEFERQAVAHEHWIDELLGDVGQDRAVRLSDLLAEVVKHVEDSEEKDS
jgi:DNA-binding MarR family transcriptional regulator